MSIGGARPPGPQLATALITLPTALHLFRDMIMIEKELTVAFSAIERLVASL